MINPGAFIIVFLLTTSMSALAQFEGGAFLRKVPQLRLKTGISSLTVSTGSLEGQAALGSIITFQPTIVWNFQELSSRIGFHYLQELGGPFGLTPLQGIGISGYYYFFGISSDYTLFDDGVTVQKSRLGPYLIGSLTPVNFNMNKFDSQNDRDNFYFSAVVTDLGLGVGFDYPVLQNILIAGELMIRTGTTLESKTEQVTYSGWSIFFSFATTYY